MLFFAVAGLYQYVLFSREDEAASRRPFHDKRLKDKTKTVKLLLSVLLVLIPLARVLVAVGTQSRGLYSVAFFFSNVVTSLAWCGCLGVLVWERTCQEETAYQPWTLLSFWVLSLISDAFIVSAVSPGITRPHPSPVLWSLGVLNIIAFLGDAILVFLGFLVPAQVATECTMSRTLSPAPGTGDVPQEELPPGADSSESAVPRLLPWWGRARKTWRRVGASLRYTFLPSGPVGTRAVRGGTRGWYGSLRDAGDDPIRLPPVLGTPSIMLRQGQRRRHLDKGDEAFLSDAGPDGLVSPSSSTQ